MAGEGVGGVPAHATLGDVEAGGKGVRAPITLRPPGDGKGLPLEVKNLFIYTFGGFCMAYIETTA